MAPLALGRRPADAIRSAIERAGEASDVTDCTDGFEPSSLSGFMGAVWYVGFTLMFAALATAAGASRGPNRRSSPLGWRCRQPLSRSASRGGRGTVRSETPRSLTMRPANPMWWLVLLIPFGAFLAVDVVAVALGVSADGLFDDVFPAVPHRAAGRATAGLRRGDRLARLCATTHVDRDVGPSSGPRVSIPWALIHVPLYLPGQMNGGSAVWSIGDADRVVLGDPDLDLRGNRRKRAHDRALPRAPQWPDTADKRPRSLRGVGHPRRRLPDRGDPRRCVRRLSRPSALDADWCADPARRRHPVTLRARSRFDSGRITRPVAPGVEGSRCA